MSNDYKKLYEYAREIHQSEIERFRHVEEKAERYLTAFGFLLTASGVMIGFAFDRFIPPHDCLEVLMFVLVLMIGAALLCSGCFIFRALKPAGLSVPPLNDEMIKFLKASDESTINDGLAQRMRDSLAANRKVVNAKTDSLKLAYWSVVTTVCLLGIFGLMSLIQKWRG